MRSPLPTKLQPMFGLTCFSSHIESMWLERCHHVVSRIDLNRLRLRRRNRRRVLAMPVDDGFRRVGLLCRNCVCDTRWPSGLGATSYNIKPVALVRSNRALVPKYPECHAHTICHDLHELSVDCKAISVTKFIAISRLERLLRLSNNIEDYAGRLSTY